MLTCPDLSSLPLLWLIDEPMCFVKCCQAEKLSWPSGSSPEFWAVAWGVIIPRKFLPALLVPCPIAVAADGPMAALWPGSPAWLWLHSAAALGPGKNPNTLPDALVLVATNAAPVPLGWLVWVGVLPEWEEETDYCLAGEGSGGGKCALFGCCCGLKRAAGEILWCCWAGRGGKGTWSTVM